MRSAHNPYVGPRPLSRDEKLYGRDHEALELADLLISERVVLLYSPSGAGKTSLIEARLKPVLEEEGFQILPTLRVGHLGGNGAGRSGAGNRYLVSALTTLAEELGRPEGADRLAETTFASYLAELESSRDEESPGWPFYELLIFDQFEEVFTTGRLDVAAEKERRMFFREIGEALRPRHRWALFAMREDYIARLDPYAHAVPTRFASTFRLDLLRQPNAAAAIQGPAADGGVEITDGAVDSLVTDLSKVRTQGSEGVREHTGLHVEPVQLQVVCHRLWQRLESSGELAKFHRIDEAHVADTVADIDRTLGDYYAETVRDVAARNGVDEREIRDWFERALITSDGIRKQVREGPAPGDTGRDLLKALVDAFLVRSVSRQGTLWYELAHDRLVQPVRDDNVRWEKEHLSLLQRSSEDWDRKNRSEDLLLRGDALREEERWAAENEGYLSATDREFLEACRQARSQSRKTTRLTALLAAVAAVALVAVGVGGKAWSDRNKLERTKKYLTEAIRVTSLLLDSQKAFDRQDFSLSGLLVLQAYRFQEGFRKESERTPTKKLDERIFYNTLTEIIRRPYFGHILKGNQGFVRTVAFSPDKRLLASGGSDKVVRVWSVENLSQEPFSEEIPEVIRSLAFSQDGKWLAAGLTWKEGSPTVIVWPVGDGALGEKIKLSKHTGDVRAVRFRPTASPPMLVSAGNDKQLVAWQLETGTEKWKSQPPTPAHEKTIRGIAFSPDGDRLASCGSDGTVRLWSLEDGKIALIKTLRTDPWRQGDRHGIRAVAFGPKGRLAAAGPVDWNGDDAVYGVTLFHPDGRVLKTWSYISEVHSLAFVDADLLAGSTSAGEVVLWHLDKEEEKPTVLAGHYGGVFQVAVSPKDAEDRKGQFIASAGADGKVRLWEKLADKTISTDGEVRAITVSEEGPVAVGLESGKDERFEDSDGSRGPSSEPPTTEEPFTAASLDFRSSVLKAKWARNSGLQFPESEPPCRESTETPSPSTESELDSVRSLARSKDGLLAAAFGYARGKEWKGHVRVYPETGKCYDLGFRDPEGNSVERGDSGFNSVAFNAAGNRLAAGSWDGTVRIWDLDELGDEKLPTHVLVSEYAGAVSVAWGRDDQYLASGHFSGAVLVWDLDEDSKTVSTKPKIVFRGHKGSVFAVAFSKDGKRLFSGGRDQTVRTWKLTEALAEEVCKVVGRNLTCEEWKRYVGEDVDYRRTCPAVPRGTPCPDTELPDASG